MTNSSLESTAIPLSHPLSHLLDDLRRRLDQGGTVTLGNLVESLQRRGIGALMVFFALPLALPSGILPGLNTIFALPLVPLTAQQALGHDKVWLPRKMIAREFSAERIAGLITSLQPWLLRLEKLLKPRLSWVTGPVASRVFGFCGLIMSLVASLPIPLTHTVPGFGLLLMAAGIVMHDGLAILLGAIIGIGYIAALGTAIAIFGPHVVDALHHLLAKAH